MSPIQAADRKEIPTVDNLIILKYSLERMCQIWLNYELHINIKSKNNARSTKKSVRKSSNKHSSCYGRFSKTTNSRSHQESNAELHKGGDLKEIMIYGEK